MKVQWSLCLTETTFLRPTNKVLNLPFFSLESLGMIAVSGKLNWFCLADGTDTPRPKKFREAQNCCQIFFQAFAEQNFNPELRMV